MNMEPALGYGSGTKSLQEVPDLPYFARLPEIEENLTRSAERIEEFISRCRGGGMASTAKGEAPKASGHFAALERIVEQMERIDKLSRELSVIG
jgi:hypothetical protein